MTRESMKIFGTILIVLISTWFSSGTLKAQSFRPTIVNYSPQSYNTEEKNITPETQAIIQDERGIIYAGVGNGVLEFDGTKWRYIQVVNGSYVVALGIDSESTIYTGGQRNFGLLSPNKKGELEYQSLSDQLPEELQDFSIIRKIICHKEAVYFVSLERIFKYSKGELTAYEPETAFHTAFLVNGQIYSRQRHLGLTVLKGNNFEFIEGTDTLEEMGVFGMISQGNQILIITRDNGSFHMPKNGGRLSKVPSKYEAEINHARILDAKRLRDGLIAINSEESGVLIIDDQLNIIHRINKKMGIRVDDVKSVLEDREGNLWLALNNGISVVNYNSPLSYYTEDTGLEGSVLKITRFNQHLIVGTTSGLFIHPPHHDNQFYKHPSISGQVWDFMPFKNQLLIGSSDGLFLMDSLINHLDLGQLTKVSEKSVDAIQMIESTGELFLVGFEGVSILDPNTFELVDYLEAQIAGVTGFVKNNSANFSDEEFWIGTNGQGIIRAQVIEGFVEYQVFTSQEDGLDSQWNVPFVYGDSVLFGDPRGLHYFFDEHYMIEHPDSIDNYINLKGMFNPANPILPFDIRGAVSHLLDTKDKVWICLDNQIMYADKRNNYELVKEDFMGVRFGRIQNFYEHNGTLWIGTADGLMRYKPNNRNKRQEHFKSIIRSFSVGEDRMIYGGGMATLDPINAQSFDYEDRSVKFTFAAPYFNDEHEVLFSYRLIGQDNKWSEWQNTSEAIFTNLREGTYTFEVRAKNVNGVISETQSITFEINPPWYRTSWAYALYAVLGIILIFVAIRLSSIRLKKKNEWLEGVVTERTKEIADKNQVLQNQKDEIVHQQKEIMDSINYAKRIQEAILPFDEEIKDNFKDSFVLFRPKDIVSGDFYWFAKVDNKRIVVCADCTGHGVPGAFMSMIGTDKLNHFVKEKKITNPGTILSEMNKGIKKSLKQVDDESSTKDGMDAAIVCYDPDKNTLQYAGAHRSLWLVRSGELTEIKATKVAVAGFTSEDQVYEVHEIDIQEGDTYYMSSDGYADQFGGPKGKKLKVKVMKELIMGMQDKVLSQQKTELNTAIEDWMQDIEQIDDICVVGLRF